MSEISLSLGRPLTLADVRQFAERCGEFGIDGSSELTARVTFGGKLKKLTVRDAPPAGGVAAGPSPNRRGSDSFDSPPPVPVAPAGEPKGATPPTDYDG